MVSNEILIKVDSLSKKFCSDLRTSLYYGLIDSVQLLLGLHNTSENAQLRKKEFWALRDISFEVRRGECVSIVGSNGAGKTTILRLMLGLLRPDIGKVTLEGRVSAFVALNAGFQPNLTGRENIYITCAIQGMSRSEIENSIDEIIEFSELDNFIDAPVRTYSSGMAVRLGFAIASVVKPDILLLDEVLAVGDAKFRAKCYNKIYELSQNCAVVLISHDENQISRLSHKSLLLKSGKILTQGTADEILIQYRQLQTRYNEVQDESYIDSSIKDVKVLFDYNKDFADAMFQSGQDLSGEIFIKDTEIRRSYEIGITLHDELGQVISHINSEHNNFNLKSNSSNGKSGFFFNVRALRISAGKKYVSLTLRDRCSNQILYWGHMNWKLNVIHDFFIPAPTYNDCEFGEMEVF